MSYCSFLARDKDVFAEVIKSSVSALTLALALKLLAAVGKSNQLLGLAVEMYGKGKNGTGNQGDRGHRNGNWKWKWK